MWIQENSQTFKNHKHRARYVFWVHSHVRGTKCGFSSIDLHTQYAFELTIPHILGLVIEMNNTEE